MFVHWCSLAFDTIASTKKLIFLPLNNYSFHPLPFWFSLSWHGNLPQTVEGEEMSGHYFKWFHTYLPKIQAGIFGIFGNIGIYFNLEFKIEFWGFEQCLAAQHKFVITGVQEVKPPSCNMALKKKTSSENFIVWHWVLKISCRWKHYKVY